MIHYTKKEIEYLLQGDWNITMEEYVEESSGQGLGYGTPRIGGWPVDERATMYPDEINDVSKTRIRFDENLIDIGTSNLAEILVIIPDYVDKNGVRAFSINGKNIEEYYPAHTRYVDEISQNCHKISFIVKTDGKLTKNQSLEVEYNLDPAQKNKKKIRDPSVNFKFFCDLDSICSVQMRITPPLETELYNSVGMRRIPFENPREAEKWLADELSELGDKMA